MIQWRDGHIVAVGRRWRGAVEVEVEVAGTGRIRALAYPALVGEPELGDRVLLNLVGRELGTGGFAFVVARPDRVMPEVGGGSVVKARYTPLQVSVAGVEDEDSPGADIARQAAP